MKTRTLRRATLRYIWDHLTVSFWFVPVVMALLAVVLAWAMLWLDALIPNALLQDSRLFLSGDSEALRAALLGIATSVLTTAGIVFTLFTLPLATVAAQYGSRLLRLYRADRTTQIVLGMFVATFVYCLAAALALPPVRLHPESPQITASVGLYLTLIAFASLIALIQHISVTLQAPQIAAAAGAELLAVVHASAPQANGANPIEPAAPIELAEAAGAPVQVRHTGYIQYIDPEYLIALAREYDLVIRLLRQPGSFIRSGETAALVWPAGQLDEQRTQQIRHAFQIGHGRTPTQDVEYAVNQLTEMAVRAMSPAINDPFTAMTCLDYLGNGLALFARQGAENPHIYDQDGRLRLMLEPVSFDGLLNAAFEMVRHASCDNVRVLRHMLAVIELIGRDTSEPQARLSLLQQVQLIEAESQSSRLIDQDRQTIYVQAQTLQVSLQQTQN